METITPHSRRSAGICLALGLITLALYLPALRHEFLAYDDQQYVTENPHVQAGLTAGSIAWAFGYHAGNWHPLAWLSHMLDCQVYGLNPAGHHLTSIVLHAANTALLFLVLLRCTGATWRSACVAALFGWHPLHVESVAWVAERKDVLCAFFWMLTLLAYTRYARASEVRSPKSRVWYALALLLFGFALMSKPMAVTLPFVLLLLDYWPLRRISGFRVQIASLQPGPRTTTLWAWLILEKLPFLALSAAACVLTVRAQAAAIVSTEGLPLLQRSTHALLAYVHYLGAMFVPRNLSAHYPYETAISSSQATFAFVLLALCTVMALRLATRRPYLAFGWLWFLGTLVPVVGLVQVGEQAWADRYTYLPLIGLFVCVVWGISELVKNRIALQTIAAAILVTLIACTTVQLKHWRNTRTLFEHAAEVTPNNFMAVTLLGSLLAKEGRLEEAIVYYEKALQYKPRYPEAHFYLGNALDQQGKLDEAIAEYQKSLGFKPALEQTHLCLGVALAKKMNYAEAETHYLAALKLNPESAAAHNNLARLLHTQGRLESAIQHYSAALKLDPKFAQAHNNFGILLIQSGRAAEGASHLREALKLNPGNQESEFNLALALNQQKQWNEAADLFSRTVTAGNADPGAHYQFALALANSGKTREAMGHFASALLAQPDFPDALDGLSWILATDANPDFRNGTEAVHMAERACELTGQSDGAKLLTLAAAYAEAGRFPEATTTAQKAQVLAASARREELVKRCDLLLAKFKLNQPWR